MTLAKLPAVMLPFGLSRRSWVALTTTPLEAAPPRGGRRAPPAAVGAPAEVAVPALPAPPAVAPATPASAPPAPAVPALNEPDAPPLLPAIAPKTLRALAAVTRRAEPFNPREQ